MRPHALLAILVRRIEKQRLIKFPDDVDFPQNSSTNSSDTKTLDEAERILQEINKINHALGYIRKQPDKSKLPHILDSSQYLFPKPATQPFHQQNHQASGVNGGTILIPSIRSMPLGGQNAIPYVNPRPTEKKIRIFYKSLAMKDNYIFRPNQVIVPDPGDKNEQWKLPTHFAIPLQLYKYNKKEYIQTNAPQEFRAKGYKIVGDVDNFYSRTKSKNLATNDTKVKPSTKYHLFFLPQEIALVEDSQRNKIEISEMTSKAKQNQSTQGSNMREEKVVGIQRPYKIQASATSSSSDSNLNTNVTTQIIRKRVIPKPIREKEPILSEETEEHLTLGSTINSNSNNPHVNTNINSNSKPTFNISPKPNSNFINSRPGILNFPNVGNIPRPGDHKNITAGNAIKSAFQNIFKIPFLQDNKPDIATGESGQTLQISPKPTFTAQAYQPTPTFYEIVGTQPPQKGNDYQWDDETSNSASDDEESSSNEHEEKNIFSNHHNAEQKTQMEAFKQGGIIIQRLKVRKGGIAIAGPGGVATAGSGGTAIVGPGGYALTHPRSLTIAGPGAKVIAIPSNVDLIDALERTNLAEKSIPREGKVVATGPTVYYSPSTGVGII